MILIDNIKTLKERYPYTWNRLETLEKTMKVGLVQSEDTRKGNKTLFIEEDGKRRYIHSKYNPIREAETIVDEYKDVKDNTIVIFYGVGLGYHIDLFIKKHPNVSYYIYEPVPEIIQEYLSYKHIKNTSALKLKDIIIADDEFESKRFLNQFVGKNNQGVLHVCLKSHINIFPDEYNQFIKLNKEAIKYNESNIRTSLAFQKRWVINSMRNFGSVLSTSNILLEKKNQFAGQPVIIVAAGPSLNGEIENLKYIKENGLAYIFSVGSALNTLIHHDIYPDAACTYDPGRHNQKVFTTLKKMGITEIPMIFGSSVGHETLLNYPGDMYHMITSQDTISSYYLKNEDNQAVAIVEDAPTIAVVTLQLLYELGFETIILVGQNLGYMGTERHSEGILYSRKLTDKEMKTGIWVKDVYGNEVLTNATFNVMRNQMEQYIKEFEDINVINTTKGGADIEGSEFLPLREVIDKNLKEKVVKENWLVGNKTNYSKVYLKSQLQKMDKDYEKAGTIVSEYNNILGRIDKAIRHKSFHQAEKMYIRLDKELKRLENNDYYKTFILPMNRVQYKILVDSIDSLNEEKDLYKKGKRIISSFTQFINACIKDMEMIKSPYNEMIESGNKFCNMNSEG